MDQKPKEIISGQDAREKLAKGVRLAAKLLAFTHGPKGQNILIENWDLPKITRDGTEVTAEMDTEDPVEKMGVLLAREVAQKTQEACGDGASRACILMDAIIDASMAPLASGQNPVQLKQGFALAEKAILDELKKQSLPFLEEDIEKIASAAASGDKEIGCFIAEALELAGDNGSVTVEKGSGLRTQVSQSQGLEISNGYESPYFINDTESMEASLENASVLVVGEEIASVQALLPALQMAMTKGEPLLLFAGGFAESVISTLIFNQMQGTLRVCAVKASGAGDKKVQNLQDIALVTGATMITEKTGHSLRNMTGDEFGRVKKATVTKDKTTLIGGQGDDDLIDESISALKKLKESCSTPQEKEEIETRIARLIGGISVIEVGGPNEVEVDQKFETFKESLKATKLAKKGGVVIGGGIALMRAAEEAEKNRPPLTDGVKSGFDAVTSACKSPTRHLIANTGIDPAPILASLNGSEKTHGFNAEEEKIVDLKAAQIYDPLTVVIESFCASISGAGNLILTETAMFPAKEESSKEENS